VSSLMKMKSIKGIQIPSQADMEKEIKAAVQLLKQTKGISNVQYKTDFTNYIVHISCDFSRIESLNAFSDILASRFRTKISNSNRYYYNAQTKVFERKFVASTDWKTKFNQLGSDNTTQFADAFYTQIVRFEKPVIAQVNNQAKVAGNKKGVLLKLLFTDLVYGKSTLANKITLTK
jgi:predicted amino acid racemase